MNNRSQLDIDNLSPGTKFLLFDDKTIYEFVGFVMDSDNIIYVEADWEKKYGTTHKRWCLYNVLWDVKDIRKIISEE